VVCHGLKWIKIACYSLEKLQNSLGVATYRLDTNIPEPYSSLIPVIDGVQKILLESEKE